MRCCCSLRCRILVNFKVQSLSSACIESCRPAAADTLCAPVQVPGPCVPGLAPGAAAVLDDRVGGAGAPRVPGHADDDALRPVQPHPGAHPVAHGGLHDAGAAAGPSVLSDIHMSQQGCCPCSRNWGPCCVWCSCCVPPMGADLLCVPSSRQKDVCCLAIKSCYEGFKLWTASGIALLGLRHVLLGCRSS